MFGRLKISGVMMISSIANPGPDHPTSASMPKDPPETVK